MGLVRGDDTGTERPRRRKPSLRDRPRVVDLDLWSGWCTVRFRAEGKTVDLRGHWFVDSFTDLVEAVADIVDGRRTACCRFSKELAGGGFVDLARDGQDRVCVAVHETAHGPDVRGPERNSSARGTLLFEANVPLDDFVRDFLHALQRIRVLTVDVGGVSPHWPHTFPQCMYEDLERAATRRIGYRPDPTHEITGIDPRPWSKREPGTFGPTAD